ncbi:MAG: beta-lactamase family protein [Gemmatimonadetes bacterium]|nr:beta-lactamase family protein [Gemmatimonadota bacterium]MYH54490.1 beta-lactamase family protein [Gemmatimonadota bacterium]MYK66726.1 beta-lactamase family protein [Gemmatimonadota bacterium]
MSVDRVNGMSGTAGDTWPPRRPDSRRDRGTMRAAPTGMAKKALLLLLPLAACAPDGPRMPDEWLPALEAFGERIAADVEADGVGAITVALARDGEVLWSGAYGWADPEAGVPATRETIYRTGSISKSVTAVLMAILADAGTVTLETPLAELVPEIEAFQDRPEGADPSLRQVASHTAGFAREPGLSGAATGPVEGWTARILESIPTTRYRTPPGTEYSYSNIGFGILGFALERAAGEPFMTQVESRIFEPLGMTGSTFVIADALQPRLSRGHANGRDGQVNTERPALEHAGRGYKVPNGGVYSTVDDMAAFAAAVMGRGGRSLLSDEMRAEVLSVQTPEDPESGYGLGFSISTVDGRVFAGHGGSVSGYTAHLLFEPATGLTAVLLRNYNRGQTSLGGAARELLVGLSVN